MRVRLLIDDVNTAGLDATLAALDAHPDIEVRLYNPFVQRTARALNFLTDFTRLNHRMHNKSFTVDNQASVVGGRNIANEYFGAGAAWVRRSGRDRRGPGVRDVSKEFDLYWSSASAYPAADFVGKPAPDAAATLEARFVANRADPVSAAYIDAVRAAPAGTATAGPAAGHRMDPRAAGERRPGQDAGHDAADRCAAVPGAGADHRSPEKTARPRLAVLRAGHRGRCRLGEARPGAA